MSLRKLLSKRRAPRKAPLRRENRAASAWRRFRRGTERYRLSTDVLGAVVMVGLIVGGIAAATGGVWPPLVIVESGSMMHSIQETSYGRFGTIDVGDMIFIRGVRSPQDVETWAQGGRDHYGRPGDVIAYAPNGNFGATPVIHRVIAYVEVDPDPFGNTTYTLHWIDGRELTWGRAGIYFPPLGLNEAWGYTPRDGYRPAYSGFITKGDNAFSNPSIDQVMPDRANPITRLIEPTWVIGVAYGEVPWIGLAKLAFQADKTNPNVPGWERIGNAYAPLELWTMFFLVIALVILVPLTLDTRRTWLDLKRERETERRLEEAARQRALDRKAADAKPPARRVTTFATVVAPPRPDRPPREG